jgi:hypothetical protein
MTTPSAALAGLWQELAAKAAATSGSRSLILMASLYQMRDHFDSQHEDGQAEPKKERAVKVRSEKAHDFAFVASVAVSFRNIGQVLAKV